MLNIMILVNRENKLDNKFVPEDLVYVSSRYTMKDILLTRKCRNAFNQMAAKAIGQGYYLIANSGYRSYLEQEKEMKEAVLESGEEWAKTHVAEPGYSEHQTGLAIDIKSGDISPFIISREYKWLLKNAHKYGFILRYPKDKENITGYYFEPWHYRYVGKKVARFIQKNNLTFEEYLERIRG